MKRLSQTGVKFYNAIVDTIQNLPKTRVRQHRNLALHRCPWALFTEADLQAIVYRDLLEKQPFRFKMDSKERIQLVHLEYPPRGSHTKNKKGKKIRYRCHDIVVLHPRKLGNMIKGKGYGKCKILLCVELKYLWNETQATLLRKFRDMYYDVKDSMRNHRSIEAAFVVIVNSPERGGGLTPAGISNLKKALFPYSKKGINCVYVELAKANPKVEWFQ